MELDEANTESWNIYLLVRSQVRVTPTGDIIDLDFAAVLEVIKMYADIDKVKGMFESVLRCFQIERELTK